MTFNKPHRKLVHIIFGVKTKLMIQFSYNIFHVHNFPFTLKHSNQSQSVKHVQ